MKHWQPMTNDDEERRAEAYRQQLEKRKEFERRESERLQPDPIYAEALRKRMQPLSK